MQLKVYGDRVGVPYVICQECKRAVGAGNELMKSTYIKCECGAELHPDFSFRGIP
ncbi:hypothetical protein RE474_09680 [Methanolobus sediminis]|uniref:Uncharacterized protein n=1 Tax=Methanolobus sediminis TaxID=3072978 RepID=A0AA51YKW6_9EURY|nr:hypothetical protein [Methanolobus sediminis]WMW24359.1 hypothetical protein RE474_09680 [Methanolobus sediminis]